jgi:hypothetical protein
MAAVRLSHKRVLLGEGIMIELIFAGGKDAVGSALAAARIGRGYWQVA